ncbi:MAG: MBL fold metallo-hydrolase, partial [Planctomycetota bacterium]
MTYPVFKIIHCSGCYSYLIGCPETRQAVLVDPKVGRTADYLNFLSLYGLRLGAVVDTHTHADHLSTSTVFAKDGVELWMSHRSACQRPRRPLGDGDELGVGNLRFRALELPGHTPDSIALYGHGMVLTGDSLFVGGLARADFRGSDPAALFDSVKEKLMALPDETLVFPGHGYNDILFSTIGTERASNPALRHASGRDYAAALGAVEGRGNTPDVDRVLALNLEADPELPESAGTAAACCAAPGAGGGDLGIRQVL